MAEQFRVWADEVPLGFRYGIVAARSGPINRPDSDLPYMTTSSTRGVDVFVGALVAAQVQNGRACKNFRASLSAAFTSQPSTGGQRTKTRMFAYENADTSGILYV
jgi:hypothetical protein